MRAAIYILGILGLFGAMVVIAFGHGEGRCHADGTRINHVMPDWWSHGADWERVHRHHYPARDYVGSYDTTMPVAEVFRDCGERDSDSAGTQPVSHQVSITLNVPHGFSEHRIDINPQKLADLLQDESPGHPRMVVWYQRDGEWYSFVMAGWNQFARPNTGFYRIHNPRDDFQLTIEMTAPAAPGVDRRIAVVWGALKRGRF